MTKLIPRELIKHLEWVPGQEPIIHPVQNSSQSQNNLLFNIDNILNGQTFYNNTKDGDNYVGLPLALEEAEKYVKENNGIIATMPYLIAGKANSYKMNSDGTKVRDNNHYLWKDWLTALSEEYIGIDDNGTFVNKGTPVVITLHGGGILTAPEIKTAYANGLTPQNAAKIDKKIFDDVLKGILPNGENIQIYTIDDIINKKISNLFGKYAVALDFEIAKSHSSGYHNKIDFIANELVLARAGSLEYLDTYFELAKQSNNTVGNWHRLNEIDTKQTQGRLLFLGDIYFGLCGDNDLSDDGRFVGVAPEAHGTKKMIR